MKLAIGAVYSVFSRNGCVVSFSDGTECLSVPAEEVRLLLAQEEEMQVSDPSAIVSIVPNGAEVLHGVMMSGYNSDKLPAGYTRLEFLKSTGSQYIDTLAYNVDAYTVDCRCQGSSYYTMVLGYARSDTKRMFGLTGRNIIMLCVENSSFIRSAGHEARERHVIEYSVGMNLTCLIDGVQTSMPDSVAANDKYTFEGDLSMYLFAKNIGGGTVSGLAYATVYSCSLTDNNGAKVRDFIPALDATGTPCMFDRLSRKPFRNSGTGQFIAGFTLAQARKLGKLPAGTTLTVSLPVGYDSDAGVVSALADAEANGCVLTIQTYDVSSAATTYALRRVWVRRQQAEHGSYVAADGSRWQVEWCVDIIGADPESLGYERYRSVDAAVEYWGLVPYEYPEEELSNVE